MSLVSPALAGSDPRVAGLWRTVEVYPRCRLIDPRGGMYIYYYAVARKLVRQP